ncbi:unnamed protein product [Malassezia sympodialis ATCC 42132]|nr:uncharacterized protein MSY001_0463 [Malassezia sympodialis ATCC 42132]CCU97757.1 unnamed protein product [Malassezia sympodialis ATCC 42132]|eukprot:XP_018739092.1 uncharacterized protein MSY001_0463 [Malassezia sympodialis ATCC 42132]
MGATTLTGIVTKAGVMAKTVTMTVAKTKTHPKLLKTYVRHTKYLVHDPDNSLSIGEHIRAQACRPLSARKRFVVVERLGFQNAPMHDEPESSQALHRAKTEAAMSAAQREWIKIEQRVKNESKARV